MSETKARLKKKAPFEAWYESLDDRTTQRRIDRRLARFEDGDTCDCWSVGEGVYEMRFHFGSGWRVYYCQAALNIYWLLGGGTKVDVVFV